MLKNQINLSYNLRPAPDDKKYNRTNGNGKQFYKFIVS